MREPHEFTAHVYDIYGNEIEVNVWYSPLDEIHLYNYANSEDITRDVSKKEIAKVEKEYADHCAEYEASLDFTVYSN